MSVCGKRHLWQDLAPPGLEAEAGCYTIVGMTAAAAVKSEGRFSAPHLCTVNAPLVVGRGQSFAVHTATKGLQLLMSCLYASDACKYPPSQRCRGS